MPLVGEPERSGDRCPEGIGTDRRPVVDDIADTGSGRGIQAPRPTGGVNAGASPVRTRREEEQLSGSRERCRTAAPSPPKTTLPTLVPAAADGVATPLVPEPHRAFPAANIVVVLAKAPAEEALPGRQPPLAAATLAAAAALPPPEKASLGACAATLDTGALCTTAAVRTPRVGGGCGCCSCNCKGNIAAAGAGMRRGDMGSLPSAPLDADLPGNTLTGAVLPVAGTQLGAANPGDAANLGVMLAVPPPTTDSAHKVTPHPQQISPFWCLWPSLPFACASSVGLAPAAVDDNATTPDEDGAADPES
mmetsp:Transcript_123634/g.395525  ORF Transcript_123634/g.395525 Transcript_123634/m.395525 type:complete len:306 (+) Transcript_123634:474-1391(+)